MRRLPLACACVLLAAGCGGNKQTTTVAQPATTATTTTCRAGVRPLGGARVAFAAVAEHPLRAYAKPDGRLLARFGVKNANGVPSVFGVRAELVRADCSRTWYRVQLPLKPNGVVGWVRARDVGIAAIDTRIVVDVSQRKLTLYKHGAPVKTLPVGVGKGATPTPVGRFYVNQRLLPANPEGPYGPAAIGVSAFSNVLTGWAQGGPIAIHGTNDPSSIGRAVSDGCVRVRNDQLLPLFHEVLAGTPVLIRP